MKCHQKTLSLVNKIENVTRAKYFNYSSNADMGRQNEIYNFSWLSRIIQVVCMYKLPLNATCQRLAVPQLVLLIFGSIIKL